jgi:pilus assembly protein CpaE
VTVFTAKTKPDGAPRFLAYVADAQAQEVVQGVVDHMLIPYAEVRQGTARDATRDLDREGSPKSLLVDVDDSEVPLSDIEALANVCTPSVKVVVVGQSSSLGLFRELIQLGVVDYITKPLTRDLVERAVRLAEGGDDPWRQRRRVGKLIAFMGARGGVGTSTIAASVAWMMARRKRRRVVLVDMDLHTGALGPLFNVHTGHGLRNALEAPDQISETSLDRTLTKLDDRLYLLNSEEPLGETVAYDEAAVDRLFDALTQQFHFVVVDLPHSPDPVHHHVLRSAQVRGLIADPTVLSARDVIRLLSVIAQQDVGVRTYLIMNRRWPQGRGDVTPSAFAKTVGHSIDVEVPYGKGAVSDALNAGEPLASRSGPVVDAIGRLVEDLAGDGRHASARSWWQHMRKRIALG